MLNNIQKIKRLDPGHACIIELVPHIVKKLSLYGQLLSNIFSTGGYKTHHGDNLFLGSKKVHEKDRSTACNNYYSC